LLRVDVSGRGPIVEEIAVGIEKSRDEITGSDGTPAVVNTLAGEGEVQTKIDGRMRFCVIRDVGKPWARNHDAGGIDQSSLKRLSCGGVNRVSVTDIVGVDDDQFGLARKAEALGERLCQGLGLGLSGKVADGSHKKAEAGKKENSFHGRRVKSPHLQ
jgi:hypothetical protein